MLDSGEYQLTRALRMLLENTKFVSFSIENWLDTGNFNVLLSTHNFILDNFELAENVVIENNSNIIQPVFIGKNVTIKNSVVGPYVSVEDNSVIENSIISNSIIYSDVQLKNSILSHSVVGSHSKLNNVTEKIYVSDYTNINF